MFRTQSMGRENCSKEAGGYKQVCNKRSRQSEHQRSGIKLRKVSVLCMGRRKLLGSLNSSLLCAPQLSGANPVSFFTLLLAFPQLLSNHRGGRQHLERVSYVSFGFRVSSGELRASDIVDLGFVLPYGGHQNAAFS